MEKILSSEEITILADRGYLVLDDFLPPAVVQELQNEILKLKSLNAFRRARVGKNKLEHINENIRSDSMSWVNDWKSCEGLLYYRDKIETLMLEFRREFYLTLKSFEAHFAVYEPGAFYLKHIDQHKNSPERQISCILYLSTLYEEEGGELLLYDKDDPCLVLDTVSPKQGRLVVFFSSWLYHEVKQATKERYSLTGWIREDEEI